MFFVLYWIWAANRPLRCDEKRRCVLIVYRLRVCNVSDSKHKRQPREKLSHTQHLSLLKANDQRGASFRTRMRTQGRRYVMLGLPNSTRTPSSQTAILSSNHIQIRERLPPSHDRQRF